MESHASKKVYTGKKIVVIDSGELFTTHKEAAEILGYPDAVAEDDKEAYIIEAAAIEGSGGTVLAEMTYDDDIILVVQGESGVRYLIGHEGVEIDEGTN